MFLLEHLWYFSPATLRRFLQRCDFTAEAICSIPYPVDGSIGSGYFSQDCRKIADRLNVRHRQQKRRIVTMDVAIVTGSAGLIGSEAARFFTDQGLRVVGIDNDMRSAFFGAGASTKWNRLRMQETVPSYHHFDADIRDAGAMEAVFSRYAGSIATVLHAAAQPSHDWAAKDPMTDFTVNANGTLVLLEMTRRYAPTAPFMYMSTNKVYGDTPNRLPLVELNTRWECDASHSFAEHGIDESMSIDTTTHSLFGVSKASADLMVQEYGRYFGMPTVCFRGGCLAGPAHSGAPLHGFLSWLVKCAVSGQRYTVLGYKGKQVRDNIHAADLVGALWHFFRNPRVAEVYNIGGGRHSQCSVLEAISICERQTGRPMNWSYSEDNRPGDHIWWISDVRKFQTHYPEWRYGYNLEELIGEIRATLEDRAGSQAS
jgi:CDP-paratose 2-epimerase